MDEAGDDVAQLVDVVRDTAAGAAERLAEERIAAVGATKRIYASKSDFSGRFGEYYKR